MWKWVRCPKHGYQAIPWEECLECDNLACHERCPPWEFRLMIYEDLIAWKPKIGVYHVTELVKQRQAYFNRTRDYVASFDHSLDLHIGRAFHEYLQKRFEPFVEVPVWRDYGKFMVIGRIDAYDRRHALIIDFKVYSSLYFIHTKGVAPEHKFQVQAYHTLARQLDPRAEDIIRYPRKHLSLVFGTIPPKHLIVWYFAKRARKRGREVIVERLNRFHKGMVKPVIRQDIYQRAKELHQALTTTKPPSRLTCPEWLCCFCPHWEICLGSEFKPWEKWDIEILKRKMELEDIPREKLRELAIKRGIWKG